MHCRTPHWHKRLSGSYFLPSLGSQDSTCCDARALTDDEVANLKLSYNASNHGVSIHAWPRRFSVGQVMVGGLPCLAMSADLSGLDTVGAQRRSLSVSVSHAHRTASYDL